MGENDWAPFCRVTVIVPCAAITLVGRGMRSLLHKLSEVWEMFGRERVHLISQSSNDLNLTFVVDEAAADGMLHKLHAELIDSGAMPVYETQVFGPRWREINGSIRPRPLAWWRAPHERARLLELARHGTPRYVYDRDHDGVPNRYDRDRDGDGVPNRYDRRPDNPYRR